MLVRIAPDGQVLYSMRLTLSLACVMVFRYYPLDTQKCNVILGACKFSLVPRAKLSNYIYTKFPIYTCEKL